MTWRQAPHGVTGFPTACPLSQAARAIATGGTVPAVAPAAKFYKVPPEHILVVSDEIHLQPGRLRIRTKGSAGGHNGLKSIIACLGTDAFPRIRIGVGAPPYPDYDMPDWVLGTFRGADKTAMDDAAARAAEACAVYIRDGADRAMSRFN